MSAVSGPPTVGVNVQLIISDGERKELFSKPLSSEAEGIKFLNEKYVTSSYDICAAMLVPPAVECSLEFLAELCIPACNYVAYKVENVAVRIFAYIFLVFIDLATLAIRLLTLPIRIIYDATERPHPLLKYLEDNMPEANRAALKTALTAGIFIIECRYTQGKAYPGMVNRIEETCRVREVVCRIKAKPSSPTDPAPSGVERTKMWSTDAKGKWAPHPESSVSLADPLRI